MARQFSRQAMALAVCLGLGFSLVSAGVGADPGGATPSSLPTPLAAPPPEVPPLEGPQVKVEIGVDAPNGPARTFVGAQDSSWINFSVWWWDTGPASSASVFVDGFAYTMTEASGGDGAYENGTLYVARVRATDLGVGTHSWYYQFSNTSGGNFRLPATGSMGELVLDRAESFLDPDLVVAANQTMAAAYATGSLTTLREVVIVAVSLLETAMASNWNGTEAPFDYTDENHYIIGPAALMAGGNGVFVGQAGSQQVGYSDSDVFPGNSQPPYNQAIALRGLLLASGLFNESDLVIKADIRMINATPYYHPYLEVALLDGSEAAGDGTADNDTIIDVDIWAGGLPTPVALGNHFGDEDNNTSDDVAWPHSLGWPPANDTQSRLVLWPRASTYNVTTPTGTALTFHVIESTIDANATLPYSGKQYWKDEPIVFDALASTHAMFLDMWFSWRVINGSAAVGPVWYAPIQFVGVYTVILTATDVYGNRDSSPFQIVVRAKTELRRPIPDGSFDEDSRLPFDVRGYFGDEDGFSTIIFDIVPTPSQIFVERNPPTAPNFSFRAEPDWCGSGSVTISATDGASPVVAATFALTVACLNDPPVITGLPSQETISEDQEYVLGNLSQHVTDADGDMITWSASSDKYAIVHDVVNDSLVFTPKEPDWFGSDTALLRASDGDLNDSWSITFSVESVNDAPEVTAPILPFVVEEDVSNVTILIADYFADPDLEVLSAEVTTDPGMEAGYFAPLGVVWFHPRENFTGPTGLTIRVRDEANASVTVHVDVNVTAANDPPEIVDVSPRDFVTGTEGDLIIFVVQAIDVDSGTLTYAFYGDGALLRAGTAATFEWQTGFDSQGRHAIEAVVADSAGGEARYTWDAQITNKNRAPTAAIIVPPGDRFETGDLFMLVAEVADPDGDDLEVRWTFGPYHQPMSGRAINISFTSAGNYTVRMTADDGEATASASIIVDIFYVTIDDPNHTGNNGTPPPQREPGFETPAAVIAIAVAAILMALVVRRKRGG